jgi:hypothetical protein
MKKLVLVETVSTARVRYVVETEGDLIEAVKVVANSPMKRKIEHVLTTPETVIGTWVLTEDEYVRLFDADHPGNTMTPDEKEGFVIKVDEPDQAPDTAS